MRKFLRNALPVLIIVIGLGILLYPSISNFLVELNGSRAVASYDAAVENLDEARCEELLAEARAYNEALAASASGVDLLQAEAGSGLSAAYEQLLDVNGTGMMGYITIPRLNETMPIYHGVSEPVLQVGVGHLPDTSLPVGGSSTHSVLSGHRGLPSAKLFTDLDQMQQGDVFYLKVLNETLAYKVTGTEVVLPTETSSLAIQLGRDQVTLVTCTPYGVNSHRLLVHAERTDYVPEEVDELIAQPTLDIPLPYLLLIIGLLVLALVMGVMALLRRRKRREEDRARLAQLEQRRRFEENERRRVHGRHAQGHQRRR